MSTPPSATTAKQSAAKSAVVACLATIESAVAAIRGNSHGVRRASDVESDQFKAQLLNSSVLVALSVQRLEDATRRLLKRTSGDLDQLSKQLSSSLPIQVTNRPANSWKHGLGGQHGNATILNGVLLVKRADGYKDDSGQERVHVLGMTIVDAQHGTFSTESVFRAAIEDWTLILAPLDVGSAEWRDRVSPPMKPGIDVSRQPGLTVPAGSTVSVQLPNELQLRLKRDAKNRSDAA